MYGQGGGGGPGSRGMGGGRRNLDDIVEGKLFLGGLDANIAKETVESYCSGWCVLLPARMSAPETSPRWTQHSCSPYIL
jgi:hypothetical protein